MLITAMTCMLVTVDRETSIINNKEPMVELKVTRISQEHFKVSFLGYSKEIKAKPIEKKWKQLKEKLNTKSKKEEVWQEVVLCNS